MTRPFRIGIIGCGKIAPRHVSAGVLSERLAVAALVDSATERSEALAQTYRVEPRIATTIREVTDVIDGAVIATPNNLHWAQALECLEAGIPVLIEKPLANSVAEGERICRESESSGLVAAVGYVTRHRANVQLLKRLLDREYFGRIRRFAYQFGSRGGWAPLSGYNLDRTATGGGVLVVTGSHFLDRLLYWFGYPEHVQLHDDSQGGPEANAIARFRFRCDDGEFVGSARFSKTARLPAGLVMETERGILILEDAADAPIRFRPSDQSGMELRLQELPKPQANLRPAADAFQLQLEDFARACTTGGEPMVTARDGLESLRLLENLYASRRSLPTAWYASHEMEHVEP